MNKMGFGEKWIGRIKLCISTASFFALVNTRLGFFQSSKGLRQGDLISLYLFVIAKETLSYFLKRAMNGGFLSACQVRGRGGEGIQVSHLLFADDVLIFCEASQDQVTYLCWLLMWFEAISVLRINLDKSELIPLGCVDNVKDLVVKLGCKVGSLPSSYLGMSLGATFKSMATWDEMEERFHKRLAMWKRQYISKGGRITLI